MRQCQVKLEVSDGTASTSALASVTVENVAPAATIDSIEKPNQNFLLPLVHTLKFAGSFADPGWMDTHTSTWDFGDGAINDGTLAEEHEQPDSTGTSASEHAYSAPGEYAVTFT